MLQWKRSETNPIESQAHASAGVYWIRKCDLLGVDMVELHYVTIAEDRLLGAAVHEFAVKKMAEDYERDLIDRDNAAKAKPGEYLFMIAEILEVLGPNKYRIGSGMLTVHPKEYADLLMRFMRLNTGGDDVKVGEAPTTKAKEATTPETGGDSDGRSASEAGLHQAL